MIWHPYVGQVVRLHYRRSLLQPPVQQDDLFAPPPLRLLAVPLHLVTTGLVLVVGRGPGPINVLVRLDYGLYLVVPRGNLDAVPESVRPPLRGLERARVPACGRDPATPEAVGTAAGGRCTSLPERGSSPHGEPRRTE